MTAQVGDRIFYDGKERILFTCPLSDYADPEHPLPAFVSPSTANWRGYVATWKVEKGELLLTDIDGTVGDYRRVGWAEVFPRRRPPVPADWFSGDLRIPTGDQVDYVHMGFGSTYAQDVILAVHRGKVILCDLHSNAAEAAPGGWRSRLERSDLIARPEGMFTDEEWAFILELRTDRAEPANWLVYADWLTDQGDARGEYLRLVVPLLALDEEAAADHPEAGRLADLEREQLAGSAWWLRLLGLVPFGTELTQGAPFHEWHRSYRRRRSRP